MPDAPEEKRQPEPRGPRKTGLDDHVAGLYGLFTDATAADRVEAQELRQLVHKALRTLSPDELRVIELRYQRKKSPGQVASRMQISRQQLEALEASGLNKIRAHLEAWGMDT